MTLRQPFAPSWTRYWVLFRGDVIWQTYTRENADFLPDTSMYNVREPSWKAFQPLPPLTTGDGTRTQTITLLRQWALHEGRRKAVFTTAAMAGAADQVDGMDRPRSRDGPRLTVSGSGWKVQSRIKFP